MGVWGPLSDENDDATDWLGEFLESPSVVLLNDAFDAILDTDADDYLEITECAVAVVAAEIVAEVLGKPGSRPVLAPDDAAVVGKKIARLAPATQARLVKRAFDSMRLVATGKDRSELYQVWHENPDNEKPWIAQMKDLAQRLRTIYDTLTQEQTK